jgi:hypothetical protein
VECGDHEKGIATGVFGQEAETAWHVSVYVAVADVDVNTLINSYLSIPLANKKS